MLLHSILRHFRLDAFSHNALTRDTLLYIQAIDLNPLSAIYFSNRAAAHISLRQYNEAKVDSTQAITLDPRYVSKK